LKPIRGRHKVPPTDFAPMNPRRSARAGLCFMIRKQVKIGGV
jgi:hypothetical protein